MQSVCVIGLGTVGLPTALEISKAGFSVVGFDTNPLKESVSREFQISSNWGDVSDCDVYVVCVPTGYTSSGPDMSEVMACARRISTARKASLVCVESTVALGTCRRFASLMRFPRLVHVPHRFWTGDSKNHGVIQPRVIGALNRESLKVALPFYAAVGVPLTCVPSLEEAELTKLVENAYRFVQIALAEEFATLCDSLKISWSTVRDAANTKWNVEIPEARDGIYGCLEKDVKYLLASSKSQELTAVSGSIETDRLYKLAKERKAGS